MAVVGALYLRTIRMPGTHLVMDRIFELYPAMCDWATMETTMKAFFWTPSIVKHWQKCHKTAEIRWKQVTKVRSAQEQPLIDTFEASETCQDEEDEIEEVDFEQLKAHTRGAPGSMIHMMRAARCPFQSRMRTMGVSTESMICPHG